MPAVVVGSTATWLLDRTRRWPKDLDILLPPTGPAIVSLRGALTELRSRSRTRIPRRGAELVEFEPWQLHTCLGGLDVFALRQPVEFVRWVRVGATGVPVTDRAVAWSA